MPESSCLFQSTMVATGDFVTTTVIPEDDLVLTIHAAPDGVAISRDRAKLSDVYPEHVASYHRCMVVNVELDGRLGEGV